VESSRIQVDVGVSDKTKLKDFVWRLPLVSYIAVPA